MHIITIVTLIFLPATFVAVRTAWHLLYTKPTMANSSTDLLPKRRVSMER